MYWNFKAQRSSDMQQEVTQRDQFYGDEDKISKSLVRETIQNSLDAKSPNSPFVEVAFSWLDSSSGIDISFFKDLFREQADHVKVSNLDIGDLKYENPKILLIEDFGTKGLTGAINKDDDCNFSDFWRKLGVSHKTGAKLGRWGLGKLVYSSSSEIGVFFGITKRDGDSQQYLMGQSVLNLRTFKGQKYPTHTFFAKEELVSNPGANNQEKDFMPVPIEDQNFVKQFCDNFSIDRTTKSGLSIVVPFVDPRVDKKSMISDAITNYFYPLITEKLKLKFDDQDINNENLREMAKEYAIEALGDSEQQQSLLFDVIEEINAAEKTSLLQLEDSWQDDTKLDESDFRPGDLDVIRKKYESGDLVGVQLPVVIRYKNGEDKKSKFSCYIKKPTGLKKGWNIYVRSGLTLPEEKKMMHRTALGAMIAQDEPICEFLADAENPAHTKWTTKTEKLNRGYRNQQSTAKLLRVIKNSVVDLYDLLAQDISERDDDALMDFFSFPEDSSTEKKRKKRTEPKPPRPVPPLPPKKSLFNDGRTDDGFYISSADEHFPVDMLPKIIKIKVAYCCTKGDAFKKYDPLDFRLQVSGGDIHLDRSDGVLIKNVGGKGNEWTFEITEVPFKITATGFDKNRDLKVDIK